MAVTATPMMVYAGTLALGEIEDHGRKDVRAYLGTGADRQFIGTYATRRDAMCAVSAAAKTVGRGPDGEDR